MGVDGSAFEASPLMIVGLDELPSTARVRTVRAERILELLQSGS